jgi:hypothetical protein
MQKYCSKMTQKKLIKKCLFPYNPMQSHLKIKKLLAITANSFENTSQSPQTLKVAKALNSHERAQIGAEFVKKIGKERRRRRRITLSWESELLQLSNEFLAYSTLNFWKIWLMSCSFASIFLVMREETEDQREERKDVHDQFTLQQQPESLKRGRTNTPCNKVASM